MAKRKRLSPLPFGAPGPEEMPPDLETPNQETPGLETKALFPRYPLGVQPMRNAPIASVAGDSAAQAALDEVADEMARLRAEGRLVRALPLAAVDDAHLVRDRMALDPDDLAELVASIRARGQQAPIEVTALGPGRWGLISGWRRLVALRQLATENPKFGTVLALERQPAEAAEAYVAMVEENEVRAGLTPYERARIAVRAADLGLWRDARLAVLGLYRAASRAKRSRIGDLVAVVQALDGALRFPGALSERQGSLLAAALARDAGLGGRIGAALQARPPADAAAEWRAMQTVLAPQIQKSEPVLPPALPAEPAESLLPETEMAPPLVLTSHDGHLRISGPVTADPAFVAALRLFLTRWGATD